MQTGSSGTLIGWKSGQTTFVPLWDRMEGAWLWTPGEIRQNTNSLMSLALLGPPPPPSVPSNYYLLFGVSLSGTKGGEVPFPLSSENGKNKDILRKVLLSPVVILDARTEYPRALTAWVTKIARVDFSRSLYHF